MGLWVALIILFVSSFGHAAIGMRLENFASGDARIRLATPIKILVAGDVLIPGPVKKSAETHGQPIQARYGFLFEALRPLVRSADLAIANLETPVSSTQPRTPVPFVFNSPVDLLRGLKWVGFDVLSLANNHSLDQNLLGLQETSEAVHREGFIGLGVGATPEEAIRGRVVNVKGVRVGLLAATSFVNGGAARMKLATGPYLAASLPETPLLEAVRHMRGKADVILLNLHWGVEYENKPRRWQVDIAQRLHKAGVDVLIGHHPHVLQPTQWHQLPDGRHGLTLYSLGNLISNQSAWVKEPSPNATEAQRRKHAEDARTREGALIELAIDENGVRSFTAHATWTDNWSGYEGGIRTVLIANELKRLQTQLGRTQVSPERSFLLGRRQQMLDRMRSIHDALGVKTPAVKNKLSAL